MDQLVNTKTFTVKHFCFDNTALKMAGYGPGSSIKEFLSFIFRLGEGLWNNTAFPEPVADPEGAIAPLC